MSGWILLHRTMLEWEWYSDANTSRLFIHCLLKANHTDKKWQGNTVKRGDFITSGDKLAKELRLTRNQVRTSIKKLKSTNEITSKGASQHTVITVVNYDRYQSDHQQDNKHITNGSPTDHQRITTTKQYNNINNVINKDKNTLVAEGSATPDCPHQKIIDLYHENCPKLARVKIWNDKRKKHLLARWREDQKFQDLEFWEKYFKYVNRSDHLTGNNDRGWRATLEWLINPSNFVKVIEGNYQSNSYQPKNNQSSEAEMRAHAEKIGRELDAEESKS